MAQEPGDFNIQPGPRNTALRVQLDVSPLAHLRARSHRTQKQFFGSLGVWLFDSENTTLPNYFQKLSMESFIFSRQVVDGQTYFAATPGKRRSLLASP